MPADASLKTGKSGQRVPLGCSRARRKSAHNMLTHASSRHDMRRYESADPCRIAYSCPESEYLPAQTMTSAVEIVRAKLAFRMESTIVVDDRGEDRYPGSRHSTRSGSFAPGSDEQGAVAHGFSSFSDRERERAMCSQASGGVEPTWHWRPQTASSGVLAAV